jgi:hypothetical protein
MINVFRLLQWYSVLIYEGSCFSLSLKHTHTHSFITHLLTRSLYSLFHAESSPLPLLPSAPQSPLPFVSSPSPSKMPMHVRLKRKNQTMFLHVDPADNFYQLKTRVGEIHGLEPEKIQILGPDKVCIIQVLSECSVCTARALACSCKLSFIAVWWMVIVDDMLIL